MNCPVCKNVQLKIAERQGIEIDYCPTCRGIWLDRGELDKIIERTDAYYAQETPSATTNYASPDKRKNDYFEDDVYEPRDSRPYKKDDRRYDKKRRKKRSFFEELIDIFD